MSDRLTLTVGETIPVTLTVKRDAVALDLTGATLELVLRKRDGTDVTTTGDLVAANQSVSPGVVTWTPDATDFSAAEPLSLRLKVTDSGGAIAYVPTAGAAWVDVLPVTT